MLESPQNIQILTIKGSRSLYLRSYSIYRFCPVVLLRNAWYFICRFQSLGWQNLPKETNADHSSDSMPSSREASAVIWWVASQPWLWNTASSTGTAFLFQEFTCALDAQAKYITFLVGDPHLGVSHSSGFLRRHWHAMTVTREHAYQHNHIQEERNNCPILIAV